MTEKTVGFHNVVPKSIITQRAPDGRPIAARHECAVCGRPISGTKH